MALLNKLLAGYSIVDETIYRTSATSIALDHDTILYPASNISIYTAPSGGGTLLTIATDYTFSDADTRLSLSAGTTIYTKMAIVNAAYQNVSLYVNYKTIGDYAKSEDLNKNFMFRNKLINGNLDLWQRGTTASVGTALSLYLADRFNVTVAGTSAYTTYSQQTFTVGQTDVPNNPKYYLRSLCTNGGDATNGLHILKQCIENVSTLSGEIATLSFYAKADAAKNITIEPYQIFGTAGSASVSITPIKITIGSTWKKYSLTFSIPSISGKTVGTANDCIAINIWMSAGSANNTRSSTLGVQTGTFDFAQFQLEKGSVPTEFEIRPFQTELELCQRYYEKSFNISIAPAPAAGYPGSVIISQIGTAATIVTGSVPYKVYKRNSAIPIFYNPASATNQARNVDSGAECSSTSSLSVAESGFAVQFVTGAGSASAHRNGVQWDVSAEY